MASIVTNKVGNYTYIYESVSYRDEKGKPQTKKVRIGKVDPTTGQPVYLPEYLERVGGTHNAPLISDSQVFSVADIKSSRILECGVFGLLDGISEQIGLSAIVKEVFPNLWEQILSLAFYVVATGEPDLYCEDWILKNESYDCGAMSSQRISELLVKIDNEGRLNFFEKWGSFRNEQEYFALDITSVSSYSELINDVAWGHNRDNEKLAQVNICLLLGENSKLPVFQMVYSGSLTDVKTLRTTLQTASALNLDNIAVVMDKGFCSAKNISEMLRKDAPVRFLIAMPFKHKFAIEQVKSAKSTMDAVENTVVVGKDILRGVTKISEWKPSVPLFAHTFLDIEAAGAAKNKLYSYVIFLRDEALKNPENPKYIDDFKKYLIVTKGEGGSLDVAISHDIVDKELLTAGWLVCVSNHIATAKDAINLYRCKDVVEKGFARLKNCLNLARLRVHSDNAMQSKIFIGFIALVLTAHIHKVMSEKELYKNLTMKKMLKSLESLRVQYIKNHRIYFPVSKLQRTIFAAFGLCQLCR